MYEIRVIENESYLEDSQKLLYRVYVEEQGWWFSKNNPAGLRVKDGRLIDNRSYIATVFGLFCKDRLIGTGRICRRVNGKFEIQEYDTGEQQSPHEVGARRNELLHQQQYVHVRRSTYEPHDKEYANILIGATMNQMRTCVDKLDKLIYKSESPMSRL
ncbi:5908_t:CDS:2 [Cetraspora pellucida]|uniref:5908_t:CDS:1 n=1 Tax=Cetraspora pellucida TaxID=1433469 RepID=A0A9N9H553_9GLOM|nr:5908_t:CDS:2 [Cetraspora pellucida]